MIDIKNAKILWRKKTGPVEVIDWNDKETKEQARLTSCNGVCRRDWVDAENDEIRMEMLKELFVFITVNHSVDPVEVHRAFCKIKQYSELHGVEAR